MFRWQNTIWRTGGWKLPYLVALISALSPTSDVFIDKADSLPGLDFKNKSLFSHYYINYIHARVLTGSTSKLFLPCSSVGQFTRASGHCPHHYIQWRLALGRTEIQVDTRVRVAVLSLATTRVNALWPTDARTSRVCGSHDNGFAGKWVAEDT